MNLIPHHDVIVSLLQCKASLHFIAFGLECSAGELRQYIEQNGLNGELEPEPKKKYPRHGARKWKPWKVNPWE